MNFSRLSLFLRLPLAVLICSQLVFLSGNVSLDEYFVASAEEVVSFDEREENASSDVVLPVAAQGNALTGHSEKVSSGLGSVPEGAALDLHATGPPTV